jgi:hypothetical protein
MQYVPTLLSAVAVARARTAVVVLKGLQVVATVSSGSSNRFGQRRLRRLLRHRSNSSNNSSSVNNNNNNSLPVGRLHPRRPRVASRVPLSVVVVAVVGGRASNA